MCFQAQSVTVAEVWLWEVGSWKAVGRLQSHSLTVTQMAFSYDDKMLLTISRDRHFSVFMINKTGNIGHKLVARQDAHKRIIWTCTWNPFSHEFATGSRDKTVKIWAVENETSVKHIATLPQFNSSVTALSWVGLDRQKDTGMLAVGMENGLIELWSLSVKRTGNGNRTVSMVVANLVSRFDPFLCHVSTVNRLAWRYPEAKEGWESMQLASCGADQCVRVFDVNVDQLNNM